VVAAEVVTTTNKTDITADVTASNPSSMTY
jgi:hypothetical protein